MSSMQSSNSSQSLVSSFASLVSNIENETKLMRYLNDLKVTLDSPMNSTVVGQLQDYEKMLSSLETSFDNFEEFLDKELVDLRETKEILSNANKQTDVIDSIERNINIMHKSI